MTRYHGMDIRWKSHSPHYSLPPYLSPFLKRCCGRFGSQPQWATCGESYPLGCRFDSNIQGGQFFTANPDRRRRMYQTPLGIYQQGCGMQNVFMSWSASEYLYLMLLLNDTGLPKEALFIIR